MNTSNIKPIGVDVAKPYLDFDLPAPHDHVPNTPEAIAATLSSLPPGAHIVCESTGGYEAGLIAAAFAAKIPISVLPPQRVRHHALSEGRLAKTDKLDAKLLSHYGATHTLVALRALEPARARLRELLRARTQLIELEKIEASWREHPSALKTLCTHAKQRQKLLQKQLKELDAEIRLLVSAEPCRAVLERLQQVQGVGEITAWTVWAEMPELGNLEPGKAAGLAGLAPHPRDSSNRTGKRYIQQGRAQLRRVLYMAAFSACRCNPILKEFYQRLRSRGKPTKLALVALARRLIELLNHMLKNPNFVLVD